MALVLQVGSGTGSSQRSLLHHHRRVCEEILDDILYTVNYDRGSGMGYEVDGTGRGMEWR